MPQDPAIIDGVTAMLTQTMRYRGFGPPLPTVDAPAPGSNHDSVAAKVRNHLDLHFQLMRGYHNITSSFVPEAHGIERPRYNPLQTIRSRRARGQLPQKFLWTITLSEEISDFSWQQNYYHAGAGLAPPTLPIAAAAASAAATQGSKGHRRGPSFSPATPRRQSARSIGSDSDSPFASATQIMPPPTQRLATPPMNIVPPASSPSRNRDSFGAHSFVRDSAKNPKLSSSNGLMQRLKAKHGDSSSNDDESDSGSNRPLFSRASSVARSSNLNLPGQSTSAALTSSGGSDNFANSSLSVAGASLHSSSTSGDIPPLPLPQLVVMSNTTDDENDNQVLPYYGPGFSAPEPSLDSSSRSDLAQPAYGNPQESTSESVFKNKSFSDDAASEASVEMIVPRPPQVDDQEQMRRAQDQLEYIISVFRITLQQNQNKACVGPCAEMAAKCGQNCKELASNVMPKYLEYLSSVEGEVIEVQEKLESGVGHTMDHLRVNTERMGSAVSTTLNRQLRETAARLDRLGSCTESKCLIYMGYATLEFFVKILLRITWFIVKLFLMIKSVVYFLTSF